MLKRLLFSAALLTTALFILSGTYSPAPPSPLTIEKKKGVSGNEYNIFYKNEAKISFVVSDPPSKKDTSILLCIPAAFTLLSDGSIDGVFVFKGYAGNREKVNTSLGGAMKIVDGVPTIFPTQKGALLTKEFVFSIEKARGDLFQQIQMIENGVAAKFKDLKLFQRRGIVIFKNGKTAVVESKLAITLKVFADDLVAMDAKDLLYTDMGSWDYGWYKDPTSGKLKEIGYNHSQTSKQTNWVIFKK